MDLKKYLKEKLSVKSSVLPYTRHMKSPIGFYPFYQSDLKKIMKVDWQNEVSKQNKYTDIIISEEIMEYIISPKNNIVGVYNNLLLFIK